jgi:hypothetical protein
MIEASCTAVGAVRCRFDAGGALSSTWAWNDDDRAGHSRGRLIVEIGIAAVRPAEFIVLRFTHKMRRLTSAQTICERPNFHPGTRSHQDPVI